MRDRVIKPLAVRRTRTDIKSVPRYNKDVNGFQKVEQPIENRYELNEHLADSIDQVERITGYDFFPTLPNELEDYIESDVNMNLWN